MSNINVSLELYHPDLRAICQDKFFVKVGARAHAICYKYRLLITLLSERKSVMKAEQVEKLKSWFDDYVADFYGGDKPADS